MVGQRAARACEPAKKAWPGVGKLARVTPAKRSKAKERVEMASVNRQEHYDVSADEMWTRIGDFHAADDWHPAIASSASSADGEVRELTLQDGAKIVERLVEQGPRSYSYRIEESPLPVANYVATIRVQEADGGCAVSWQAEFQPSGASEDEAVAVIAGVFEGGLDALKR
jgi:polyketide cyclase/dehydrase/lipid transport protein